MMHQENTNKKAQSLIPLSLIPEEHRDSASKASQGSFDNLEITIPIGFGELPDEIEFLDTIESSDSSSLTTTEEITSKDESKREFQKLSVSNEPSENSENKKNVLPLTIVPKRKRTDAKREEPSTSTPPSKKSKKDTNSSLSRSLTTFSGLWKSERLTPTLAPGQKLPKP